MRGPFGRYRLLSRLAVGGMGEVYLGVATGPGGVERKVAIKVVRELHQQNQAVRQMFIEEAKVCFLLTHPNIVQTFEIGEVEGETFLVMEYVEGVTLAELNRFFERAGQPVPTALALYIAAQIARGLDYAHDLADAAGRPLEIVHRDISPGNVLLSTDGQVKIGDFGLARSALRRLETASGTVKGKLAYMAPEQVRAEPVDRRCDLFALGVMLYEMLGGRHPFGDPTELSFSQRLSKPQVPELGGLAPLLPRRVVELVERSMASERAARPASAQEVIREIDACQRQGLVPTTSDYDLADRVREARGAKKPQAHPFDKVLGIELKRVVGDAEADPHVSTYAASAPLPEAAQGTATAAGTTVQLIPSNRWPFVVAVVALLLAGGLWLALGTGNDALLELEQQPPDAALRPPLAAVPDAASAGEATVALETTRPTSRVARATLHLRPQPSGGKVWVGGRLRGTAPLSLAGLLPGPVRVEIRTPGHTIYRQTVVLDPGAELTLSPRLHRRRVVRPRDGRGTLSVNSEPWSIVFVDGKRIRGTPLVKHELPVGRHRVRLHNPKLGLGAQRTVEVRRGQETRLIVELVKGKQ